MKMFLYECWSTEKFTILFVICLRYGSSDVAIQTIGYSGGGEVRNRIRLFIDA